MNITATYDGRRVLPVLRLLSIASFLGVLGGCAPYSFPPVTDYCPPSGSVAVAGAPAATNGAECTDLPWVATEVRSIGGIAKSKGDEVNNKAIASQVLDVATFGLATGFAVKVVHGGALTNSAKNLALAAGASYTAGTLFFPRASEQAYLDTSDALYCVAQHGNNLLVAYGDVRRKADLEWKKVGSPPAACLQEKQYLDMKAAKEKSDASLNAVAASDKLLAQLLNNAKSEALKSLRKQSAALRPSPEAFLHAGDSALAVGNTLTTSSYSTAAVLPGAKGGPAAAVLPVVPQCKGEDLATFDKYKVTFEALAATISTPVNNLSDLSKACSTTAVASGVTALKVSQDTVTLHPGDEGFVLTVSGGRAPIRASWIGERPSVKEAVYTWREADREILLQEPSGATGGNAYTLRVFDSSLMPNTTEIKVKTSK